MTIFTRISNLVANLKILSTAKISTDDNKLSAYVERFVEKFNKKAKIVEMENPIEKLEL